MAHEVASIYMVCSVIRAHCIPVRIAVVLFSVALLGSCASGERAMQTDYGIGQGNLPPPDVTLRIEGLRSCIDNPDRSLHLKLGEPVHVLVHRCFLTCNSYNRVGGDSCTGTRPGHTGKE
jgi:hypothetical protein